MIINEYDIKQISFLARIGLHKSEISRMQNKINDILIIIKKIKDVNTENIAPIISPCEVSQRLRKDIVIEEHNNKPYDKKNHLYLVPKII